MEVSPEFKALWRKSRAFDKESDDCDSLSGMASPTPIGPWPLERESLRAAKALWADDVSPEARALWICFKVFVILSPGLEPEELDWGALERMSDKTLCAVEMSPEFNALWRESKAFDR